MTTFLFSKDGHNPVTIVSLQPDILGKFDKIRLEAYFIGYFPDLSGARGRNRTTDTRIFNRDGNK
jgi:hypothetical protein